MLKSSTRAETSTRLRCLHRSHIKRVTQCQIAPKTDCDSTEVLEDVLEQDLIHFTEVQEHVLNMIS